MFLTKIRSKHGQFKVARAASLTALLGCVAFLASAQGSHARDSKNPTAYNFDKNFMWGAASAAYQTEGDDRNSDWWEWEAGCHIQGCERSGMADDGYHRYEEDLDLAQSMGLNTYRLSIEWARVEPSPGVFSEKEFEHYRAVLKAAHARGMRTMLTLQHFTLPLWVAHNAPAGRNSWLDPAIPKLFERYVERTVKEVGGDVDLWLTINEPTVSMLTAYIVGVSPPGVKDIKRAPIVLANFLKAHALAYHKIHERYPHALVSFAHHMRIFDPNSEGNPFDSMVAGFINDFWNHQFLRSIMEGRIVFHIPFLTDYHEEFPALKGTLDYIGLNYYTRDLVQFDLGSPEKFHMLTKKNAPHNDLGWEIYPHGMYRTLMSLKQYHLPVVITENGIADAKDKQRAEFICNHLLEMKHAMRDGVDVWGYIHWALMDNFEWSAGSSPRFGLIAVDYATQKRTIRSSAHVFSNVIRANNLDACLAPGQHY